MFACITAAVAVGVHAANESVQLQYSNSPPSIDLPAGEASAFWERFKVAFDRRADDLFADRFHPFNVMKWSLDLGDRDNPHVRATSTAQRTLSKSVVYGAREAAVDLPIMAWLEERQGFLADFLRNSLGNVEEEAVAPVDLSYRLVERSWWRRLSESGEMDYGIRPFRTDPYAFFSLGIKDGDRLLLLSNVRYHYSDYADHRFELAMSVPVAHGFSIDVGTSYKFGQHDDEKKLVVKLFKGLKGGGIMHVGLQVHEIPALFAGISVPW